MFSSKLSPELSLGGHRENRAEHRKHLGPCCPGCWDSRRCRILVVTGVYLEDLIMLSFHVEYRRVSPHSVARRESFNRGGAWAVV